MEHYRIIDNLTANLSVKIKLSLLVHHPADWKEHRTKTNYTLWNIQRGNVHLHVGEQTFTAVPGDVVFFYPGDTYSSSTDSEGCSFLYNRFSLEMGNRVDIIAGLNMAGIIKKEQLGNRCLRFCSEFQRIFHSPQRISLEVYALFLSYLSQLFDVAARGQEHFYPQPMTSKESLIDTVLSYIQEHFTEDITVSELASVADLSEKYFISFFHANVGMTPKKYILQCRMQMAAELLSDPGNRITDIALKLGYADRYSFSKTFKKFYEESPASFREHF